MFLIGKGYDTSKHILACFGGAGGQHACAIAQSLGMDTIIIHKYAGILSAFGMAMADVVVESQQPMNVAYNEHNFDQLKASFESQISEVALPKLQSQSFDKDSIEVELYLNLRYDKTDCSLMVPAYDVPLPVDKLKIDKTILQSFKDKFSHKYKSDFGFSLPNRVIVVDDVRIRAVGKTKISTSQSDCNNEKAVDLKLQKVVDCHFYDGGFKTNVVFIKEIPPNLKIKGPTIIIDKLNTILIEPNCSAVIDGAGNVVISVTKQDVKKLEVDSDQVDFVELSIFSHRFMSIAEQMGRVLQKTAISTNIKERLDFSCAMFGPDGGLVANAPHIPVHLGAMQVC